ncbi:MAG: stalk domain-containing protein [Gudongella sp.]|nr:stalk domain-containing protein [Gudongella sp.]
MLKQRNRFLIGVVFTLAIVIMAGAVFATVTDTKNEIHSNKIKVLLNGRELLFKDALGNNVEPLNLNGTVYVPIRGVSETFDKIVDWDAAKKEVKIYDGEIEKFWDNLIEVPQSYTGLDIYWRFIDDEIMETVDNLISDCGVEVLFKGLESTNVYSQYYCINRLVEYYNDDEIKARAIGKIEPFMENTNNTIADGAKFAISVLTKEFDNPYIINIDENTRIFTLFNDYSDYGSYNELWIIKHDKLSKLYSFSGRQTYVDGSEKIQVSPLGDKIAVQTSSRISSSINIIDLESGEISPELMVITIEKIAKDNKDYNNTYPDGRYSWSSNLKWVDNNTLKFDASISFDFMEIIDNIVVEYNYIDGSLVYEK